MLLRQYFVYIITNTTKTVLYTGVTNNLSRRLSEHYQAQHKGRSFAGQYKCYWLLHYETFRKPSDAIHRETEIKAWRRDKKVALLETLNPEWKFLNEEIMDWPPKTEA